MSEQEKIKEEYNALIMKETEKAILVEPLNFKNEESIWIPKSQFLIEGLEIKPWMLKKLGFETEAPLKLQLPEGGWPAVERKYPRVENAEEEAKQEAVREKLKGPGSGATVVDDNPANETLKDRDGEDHIMTLNEKLTEIKVEAIENGIGAVMQLKLQKHVKTLALIWNYVRADKTFKKVTEIQKGYAVSAIFKEHNREEHEHTLPPQDDDSNVVRVYKIPYMGGGVSDNNNEEGPETVPETD
jgi:hypothetical protein